MSFFDKITDAAKQAKKALDESGVIDDIAESISEATSATPADQPNEGSQQADVPSGIVDPASLLTIDEVSDIGGVSLESQYPFYDEEWIGTIFSTSSTSSREYFELRVAKPPEGEEFDPDGMWQFLTTEVEPREPVPGISEGAFRSSDDIIYFRVGDQVLHTVGNLGPDATIRLAQLAAERLKG